MRILNFAKRACALFVLCPLLLGGNVWAQGTFKTLYAFSGKNGAGPGGFVIFDAAGNIYGAAAGGIPACQNGCGVVYELTPNANGSWSEKVLHHFGTEDLWPYGGLTFDTSGNLYGMTNQGPYAGNVYELSPQTSGAWTYTVLYQMGGAYDGNPAGGLTFDALGNFYGTSAWGCGYGWGVSCIFEMTPSGGTWTFNLLYGLDFTSSAGWYPSGTTPIFDAKGNLYVTTAFGGDSGCSPYGNGCYGLGVALELSPNGDGTWTETILHTFTGGTDGESPACALVFDAAGNLYGTTYAGGAYGYGNVFELIPNADGTWMLKVLHEFAGGKDGATPVAGVTLDSAGNVYGTTYYGGAAGDGVVFKLTPTSSGGWAETLLHTFVGKDGQYPSSSLTFGPDGNLYGTTAGNYSTTFGTVFEVAP